MNGPARVSVYVCVQRERATADARGGAISARERGEEVNGLPGWKTKVGLSLDFSVSAVVYVTGKIRDNITRRCA